LDHAGHLAHDQIHVIDRRLVQRLLDAILQQQWIVELVGLLLLAGTVICIWTVIRSPGLTTSVSPIPSSPRCAITLARRPGPDR